MQDAQRIIEEIKHLLYSAGNPLPDEVLSVAADYQDLCNAVNDRLRTCSGLLRRGLRSEAIQMADQEPNLLDLVATLDFAERPQWSDYLRQMGEMLPPDLLMDAGAELNEAYAAEQPLLKLLRRHRKRALARAPLAERIEVLRAIAQADPLNNVWQEDLQTFEVARHRQIEAEVNVAAKSGDLPALATLESEIFAADWRNPPSEQLRTTIKRGHARLRQQQARDELAALEPELTAAHAAFDAESARRIRGRWEACAQLAGLGSNELLSELAAPALAWLYEEDRREETRGEFDAAVYELEQKLDSGASREQLKRAFYKAHRYETELPARVEHRLREQIAAIDAASRRRLQLIIAGMVCAILLFGAGITVAIRHKMFTNAVTEAAAHVKAMLDEEKLDEAKQYLASLSHDWPDVAHSGPVREQTVRYEGMQATEDQRHAQFQHALKTADDAANFAEATLKSLGNAEEQLKNHVSPLAHRAEERTDIEKLEERITSKRIEVEGELNDKFAGRLNELIARYDELKHGKYAPAASIDDGLADFSQQLNSLGDYSEAVGPELMANYRALVDNLAAMKKHLAAIHLSHQWEQNVTRVVGDTVRFDAMLRAYGEKFRDTARANDFRVSATEMPLWSALQSWNEGIQRLRPERPDQWLAEANKLLADPVVSKLPMIATIKAKLPYFEAAAKRPTETLPKAIEDLLGNPLISGLYTIDVYHQDGKDRPAKRYYVRSEPKYQPDGRFKFEYVKNFQLEEQPFELRKGQHLISKEDVVLRSGEVKAKAPQWELADAIRDVFQRRRKQSEWEATFFDTMQKVVDHGEVDPIIKMLFLKKLVDAGKNGSLVFAEATQALAQAVSGADADANWLLPDDAQAVAERSKAAAAIDHLPSLAAMRKDTERRLASMQELPTARYQWIGWLARVEADGKTASGWQCLVPQPITDSGKLIVILRPQPEGPIQLVTIGQAERGRLAVTLSAGEALVEGRPVFLVEE